VLLPPPPPRPRANRIHFQKTAKTKGDFPTIAATATAASPTREPHPFSKICKNEGTILTKITATGRQRTIKK